jgi:hypothetical protein
MGGNDRIPVGTFAAAMADLDRTDLAEFVADVYRETGDVVDVDPPVVTVHGDGDPIRLGVLTGESDPVPDDVDAVVTPDPDPTAEEPTVGPDDLRQRVLYALPPARADELCEAYLDCPARAPEYVPETPAGLGGERDEEGEGRRPLRRPSTAAEKPLSETPLEPLADLVGPQVVLVGLLAAVVLATSAGAVFVGGLVPTDGDEALATAGEDPSDQAAATPTATSGDGDGSVEEPPDTNQRDWGGWEAIPNGLPNSGETPTPTPTPRDGGGSDASDLGADRYADLEPTCERSYLHVVQIQMNALKYNDNATNDGIRTVRRFASPRNREAVGSLQQYVRIIESPTYAPMLTYDSAEYTPWRFGEDRAQVRVVIREDGNVTARYAFRLRKQDGEEYDGCWMTEGVQSLTESTGSDVE